jgi:hypothetical protein
MITKTEAQKIRRAIRSGLNPLKYWSCWILTDLCGSKVTRNYANFFEKGHRARWEGLYHNIPNSTPEENLQRELMLELFALTRGKL